MKNAIILITLFVFPFVLSAQSVETVFNFSKYDLARDIIKLDYDDGFLIVCTSTSDNHYGNDFIRLNYFGDTLWTKQTSIYGKYLLDFDSNYYYLAGNENVLGTISKTDKNLNLIWKKSYPPPNQYWIGSNAFLSIKKTTNHKLILLSQFYPDDGQQAPLASVCLYDSSGTFYWYRNNNYVFLQGVNLLSNDDIFCTGLSYQPEITISKFDTTGYYFFSKVISATDVYSETVAMNQDTAYIFSSYFSSSNSLSFRYNNKTMKVFKVSANLGDTLWVKDYFKVDTNYCGAYDPYYNMGISCYGTDGNIHIVVGYKKDGHKVPCIFTINSSGDSLSCFFIDKFNDLRPKKIITYDNSLFFIGTIRYGNDSSDIYFLKAPLDTLYVDSPPQIAVKTDRLNLSPNPAAERVTVSLNANSKEPTQIKVFRINGTAVYNKTVPPGMGRLEINVSSWPQGLYIFTLYEEGVIIQSEKVVVIR